MQNIDRKKYCSSSVDLLVSISYRNQGFDKFTSITHTQTKFLLPDPRVWTILF